MVTRTGTLLHEERLAKNLEKIDPETRGDPVHRRECPEMVARDPRRRPHRREARISSGGAETWGCWQELLVRGGGLTVERPCVPEKVSCGAEFTLWLATPRKPAIGVSGCRQQLLSSRWPIMGDISGAPLLPRQDSESTTGPPPLPLPPRTSGSSKVGGEQTLALRGGGLPLPLHTLTGGPTLIADGVPHSP
ncbi:hypothetical protein NDU88_000412 [Pleurodeles waltl]|uniref:Uncharacterized protein n=1 Tax=Pleurodeles waltl TaxID=8319 RepID=A0AAV7URS9_PLEWA|nr:hypothetical protein NDU88_000412 [Pleurodeles waltl]